MFKQNLNANCPISFLFWRRGITHYGSEIDLQIEYSVTAFDPKLILGAKYAAYQAADDTGANLPGTTTRNVDTDKIWVYAQYAF